MRGEGEYSEQFRDEVYEIWCLRANRSPTLVAEIVRAEQQIELSRDIISQWSKRYKWSDRFMTEMQRAFPASRRETAANLVAAGLVSSRRLLAVVHGAPMQRGEDKILFGSLDRAGFSPVGSRDPISASAVDTVQTSSLLEKLLSEDDLAEIRAEGDQIEALRPGEEEDEGQE